MYDIKKSVRFIPFKWIDKRYVKYITATKKLIVDSFIIYYYSNIVILSRNRIVLDYA